MLKQLYSRDSYQRFVYKDLVNDYENKTSVKKVKKNENTTVTATTYLQDLQARRKT